MEEEPERPPLGESLVGLERALHCEECSSSGVWSKVTYVSAFLNPLLRRR
jgi:hypothetical protein